MHPAPFTSPLCVDPIQGLQPTRQVSSRRFDKQVVVVGHKAIGMRDPTVPSNQHHLRISRNRVRSLSFKKMSSRTFPRLVIWQTAPSYSSRKGMTPSPHDFTSFLLVFFEQVALWLSQSGHAPLLERYPRVYPALLPTA